MIELPQKFFQKAVNDGFITATRQAVRYTQSHVIRHFPPSLLYWYFEIISILSNRSDANPIDPIWVDPDMIEYYHSSSPSGFGRVVGGEWDKPERLFKQNIVYRSIKSRYIDELPWDETEIYQVYKKLPESESIYARNFENKEELHDYFNRIDELYKSISENGYKTQRELLEDGESVSDPTSDTPHILLHEITIHIYRDGSLAKYGSGNHRLSVAKVHPDIEKIPVLVRARHTEWQQIRDEIRNTDSYNSLSSRAKQYLNHPDLKNIVPENWIN